MIDARSFIHSNWKISMTCNAKLNALLRVVGHEYLLPQWPAQWIVGYGEALAETE